MQILSIEPGCHRVAKGVIVDVDNSHVSVSILLWHLISTLSQDSYQYLSKSLALGNTIDKTEKALIMGLTLQKLPTLHIENSKHHEQQECHLPLLNQFLSYNW